MTLFGKILVFVNFAFSVLIMAWAMMFYINRIDWAEGDKDHPGELKACKERVADLWNGLRPAELSWREVHAELLEQEGYRVADLPWYLAEFEQARTKATEADPARTVVYDKGVLVTAPVNPQTPKHVRPKMAPATIVFQEAGKDAEKNLASLKSYRVAEGEKREAILKARTELGELIKEDVRLTNLLTPVEGKGLRQRIEDEKLKVKLASEEQAILRPLLVNTSVESELILRRRQMLEARIKELAAAAGIVSGIK